MTRSRYSPGKVLKLHGRSWTVIGPSGDFYTVLERDDGERRTVSTMSIHYGVDETRREKSRSAGRKGS